MRRLVGIHFNLCLTVSNTHTSLREGSSRNTPGSIVDMMLPERFLVENVIISKFHSFLPQCRNCSILWGQFICLLQFGEISQSLEYVCRQAANTVVGQVAKSGKR